MKKFIYNTISVIHYALTFGALVGVAWTTLQATNPELVMPVNELLNAHPLLVEKITFIGGSLIGFAWVFRIIRTQLMENKFHIDIDVKARQEAIANEVKGFIGNYDARDNVLLGVINDLIKRDDTREYQLQSLLNFNILQAKRNLESNLVSETTKAEISQLLEALKQNKSFEVAIGNVHKYIEIVHKYIEPPTPSVEEPIIDERVAAILRGE